MNHGQLLDDNMEYEGGILITATAKAQLAKAVNTATLFAIFLGISILVSFFSNLSQIYSSWVEDFGGGMPKFYKVMQFYHLIMVGFQVVVLSMLLKFIGKGKKLTTVNFPFGGDQTFSALNSLFLWQSISAGLIILSTFLYLLYPWIAR